MILFPFVLSCMIAINIWDMFMFYIGQGKIIEDLFFDYLTED